MANTTPTPAGPIRRLKLIALLVFWPARFLELEAEDNATLNAITNPTHPERALVVRGALFASLGLVVASAAFGYASGIAAGYWFGCAPSGAIAWFQIVGTSVLLWGTLFIRGWDVQSHGGVTLTERVNQWIYRALYCVGTATLVCSVAIPACR